MMTMSSMLTSRKRNNRASHTKILVSILGFLCCGLVVTGCSGTPKNSPDDGGSETAVLNQTLNEEQLAHVAECSDRIVSSTEDTELVVFQDGKPKTLAVLKAGAEIRLKAVDVQLITGPYLPVAGMDQADGSEVALNALKVTPTGRWLTPVNHLLEKDFLIRTRPETAVKELTGQTVLTWTEPAELRVYAENEDAYGVELQGRIVWIDKAQAESVMPMENAGGPAASSLPVLMYHFFYSEANGESRKSVNDVEVEEFREQLSALQKRGYTALTMREVEMMMKGWAEVPEKSVAITIDDGDPSVYQYAYPVLKKFGYNATLFLITGWMTPEMPYEFFEMREDGLELQSHSFLMHQGGCREGHGGRLLCVDRKEGVEDTRRSLDYVDGGFVYCYPFGDVNDHAVEILKEAGVELAFTTEYGKIKPGMDRYRLPRIRVTGGAGLNRFIKSVE